MFDEDAFAAFYVKQTAARSVRRFARTFHVPEDVAVDITQDALMSLWRHREKVAASRWAGWSQKTLLRGVFAYSRDLRRARRRGGHHVRDSPRTSRRTPRRRTAPPRVRDGAASPHHFLGPERRDVVKLYLIDELPMKEVAEQARHP